MNLIVRNSRLGWGICILILAFIFSPVLSTQPDAHPGSLYVVPIVMIVYLMSLLSGRIRWSAINLYSVLLLLFAIFSTIISGVVSFGTGLLKFLVFIIFFISISSYVLTPKQLKFSFVSYLFLSITIAILIILSFIFGYPHIDSFAYQGRYSIGITGLFKNPNYLSSFYNAAFFVVCYILATVNINLTKKLFFYLLLSLFIVATFFTGTRAALITEAVIMVVMLIVSAKKKHIYKFIPTALIIALIIAYYWTTLADLYDLFVGTRELTSDSIRERSWSHALNYVKDNLLLGCGHKTWDYIHFFRGDVDEYLHNVFLELILDMGIIGFSLIILIITIGYNKTKNCDRLFLLLLLFTTGFPMLFQNGLYEVNFWRFIIINRLMMNVSKSYEGGINNLLIKMFGDNQRIKP